MSDAVSASSGRPCVSSAGRSTGVPASLLDGRPERPSLTLGIRNFLPEEWLVVGRGRGASDDAGRFIGERAQPSFLPLGCSDARLQAGGRLPDKRSAPT